MTRINLIDPVELTDQHLIAEYREIRLLCANFVRSMHSKRGLRPEEIPKQFTLNTGHVRFFYDKGLYLHKRYDSLKFEMVNRGFSPNNEFPVDVWTRESYNDWHATSRDKQIVRERIQLRISQKPNWYRYKGKPLNESGLQKSMPDPAVSISDGVGCTI